MVKFLDLKSEIDDIKDKIYNSIDKIIFNKTKYMSRHFMSSSFKRIKPLYRLVQRLYPVFYSVEFKSDSYIIPGIPPPIPPPGIGGIPPPPAFSSGFSAIMASVVSITEATLAAF